MATPQTMRVDVSAPTSIRRASANGIQLAYREAGEGEPLVLVMGIGAQLVHWPSGFVAALVDAGFRVICFDNRDVGESTWLDALGNPDVATTLTRSLLGLAVRAPYDLTDMALDVVGLLDALELDSAHVAGVSMGGMVAQTLALRHGARVRSLTSIMSSAGGRRNMLAAPRGAAALLKPPGRTRDAFVRSQVEFLEAVSGGAHPIDRGEVAAQASLAFERGVNPRGFARQLAASLSHGNREAALRFVRTPTLVIHGDDDPLLPTRGAVATARAIPNATLELIPGMGHSLPRSLWPQIVSSLARHASRAGSNVP